MGGELPMFGTDRPSGHRSDLVRTAGGLALWAPPIVFLLLASGLAQAGVLPLFLEGPLVLVGTFWFGLLCLANAFRCNRVHCWVDGVGLPVLGAVGVVVEVGWLRWPWSEYLSVLWGIVVLSFVAECFVGPYVRRRARPPLDPGPRA